MAGHVTNLMLCEHNGSGGVASVLLHWGKRIPLELDTTWQALVKELRADGPIAQLTHLKGIGHLAIMVRLLKRTMSAAAAGGAEQIVIAVPADRERLYERLGFEVVASNCLWTWAWNGDGNALPVSIARARLSDRLPEWLGRFGGGRA